MTYFDPKSTASGPEEGTGPERSRDLVDLRPPSSSAGRLVPPGPVGPANDAAAAPDAMALVRSIRRRFVPAVGLGLIASMVAALALWAFMPSPKYMARATLQAASAPPRVISTSVGERVEFGTYMRTQIAFLKSRLVLKELLARPGIARLPLFRDVADPLEWLEREVVVESSAGTELLRISLKGEYPEQLARVVNELAVTYLKQVVDQENRERSERLGKLTDNYNRYLDSRHKRRDSLKGLAEQVGSNDRRSINVRQELDMERLDLTRRELLFLQTDLRKARVELGVLETRARQEPGRVASAWAMAGEVATDPVVDSLARRLVELEGRLASARRTIRGEDDPVIRRSRQDLEAARRSLAERREQVIQAAGQRMGEKSVQDLADRIAAGRERVAILEEHERVLSGEVDRLADEAQALNRTSIALENSRGEMDQADEMVKRVAAEIEGQKLEQLAPSRVRILEKAEVPSKRDDRTRLKTICGGAAAAFALALLSVTWREAQAGRVDSTKVVKQQLGLRLLGVLPNLEDRHRRRIARPNGPRGARQAALYFESIDALRAMVLRALGDKSPLTLLITSALKAEGKTSLSCHLAASLARAGMSTLLVDGDLRIPSAHKLLALPSGPGLSEVLRGELDAAEAIRPSTQEGLMFLPAGDCDAEALDALSRGHLGGVFAGLRERFEVIVVDSSPVLPVADPILFGRHCDAIIFSVLENVSTVPAARAAFDRLASLDVPVLGAVVAGSPMMNYKYQFYMDRPAGGPKAPLPGASASSATASLPGASQPLAP